MEDITEDIREWVEPDIFNSELELKSYIADSLNLGNGYLILDKDLEKFISFKAQATKVTSNLGGIEVELIDGTEYLLAREIHGQATFTAPTKHYIEYDLNSRAYFNYGGEREYLEEYIRI